MSKFKILIVDDEEDLCEILQFNLEKEGFTVDTAYSANSALKMELNSYHLFVLDIMMGDISGTKLAKMIKKDSSLESKPIIFLTAKDSEIDKLMGFNIGADDYITKPFSVKEVSARINAVLKRVYQLKSLEIKEDVVIGNLKIDIERKRIYIEGRDTNVTKKEFDIVYLLVKKMGRVFSREEILMKIWEDDGEITDRTVDVNIRRIRKKFGIYGKYIQTRSGYGYSFEIME
ncbi:MAG: DNA-binding response regulator [Candidatus Cloacimonadota bacterium]|nr:MAG: DNA-binding response regulator [Candidatus Cloacimonadota bacterium]PIE77703.1 MAG: DNA-binding response regulator [Candidatus Delongbacteria bacterium]